MNWRWFYGLLFVVFTTISVGSLYVYDVLMQPNSIDDNSVVTIAPGSALYPVLRDLARDGTITDARIARWYARAVGLEGIRAGEFEIPANSRLVDILRLLNSDAVLQYQVTLVEGHTTQSYINLLKQQPKLRSVINDWTPEQILAAIGATETHIEGLFAPETYTYTAGLTDIDILKLAYKHQTTILQEAWAQRAKDLPIKTPYEALVLASVIEKETGMASERRDIAGVFVRRLQQGIRLQSDPTTIYGIGPEFDGNLTTKHLRAVNEYNTYAMHGLPKTPIANPGAAAIAAALQPADGTTLYFVAKGDGSHQFSATLAEHNRAVLQYQRHGRRSDYQSSPTSTTSDESR